MLRRKLRTAFAADLLLAALIAVGSLFAPWTAALAQVPDAAAQSQKIELLLEVWINGHKTNLIAPFVELPDGSLAVSAESLDELDIVLPSGKAAGQVRLDAIKGLTYRLDRATQVMHLTMPERMRRAKIYDATRVTAPVQAGRADFGALINYSLFGSASQGISRTIVTGPYGGFNGVNATLDGRMMTPYGNFYQSALVGTIPSYAFTADRTITDVTALRYDTYFTHSDPETYMTYRAGDTINGALSWTRPVRMAGFQVQRNFTARPDIVAQAFPSVSGTAAAPSSVDVFVNGIKTYSQQVGAGPFQLSNVPATGGGEARVVVRDASGKEVETKLPIYSSPALLRPGLYEMSAEGGLARYNYGLASNDYGDQPIGSATLRAGITDWLTGEAHAEGGMGLANGGAGAVINVADRAIVTTAVSGSLQNGKTGVQLYGSVDTRIGPVTVHAQTSRGISKYADLTTATARLRPTTAGEDGVSIINGIPTKFADGYLQVVSRDQVTISAPVPFDNSSVSATWVRSEIEGGHRSEVVSVTYARPFIARSNLFATAYMSIDETRNSGLYAGVSMPLGDASVSASVSASNTGATYAADAAKPLGLEPGSWGYRVRDSEGELALRSAAVMHRTEKARLEASVSQDSRSVRETVEASGSIVAMGGGIYMANRIDDGFAVVNTGAPGVRVLAENRFVGETDSDGMILVPNLRSNQKNQVSIDPTNLSISAEVDTPVQEVVPAYRSGVAVDFKVRREGSSAIVVLTHRGGAFVDAGSNGQVEGGDAFMVGYDGQAFIKNLKPHNSVVVKVGQSECRASFAFRPKPDEQVTIGPVVCE